MHTDTDTDTDTDTRTHAHTHTRTQTQTQIQTHAHTKGELVERAVELCKLQKVPSSLIERNLSSRARQRMNEDDRKKEITWSWNFPFAKLLCH
jgi:hypothetical protein